MSTETTTTVDVGRPPAPVPEPIWLGQNLPHRPLPHTGADTLAIVGVALVVTLVGVVLVRWARRRRLAAMKKTAVNAFIATLDAGLERMRLANMVGNSAQDFDDLAEVAESAGVALGQLAEYAAGGTKPTAGWCPTCGCSNITWDGCTDPWHKRGAA